MRLDESGVSWPMTELYTGPERRRHARDGAEPRYVAILVRRLWSLIAFSDTTPTRFLLGLCATSWAGGLLLPGQSLDREAYHYFAAMLGAHADQKFAAVWAVYAALTFWRIFSPVPRPAIALAINIAGAMLFASVPLEVYVVRSYPFPIGIAPHIVVAWAAAWVAVRTNINPARGWRAD